MKKKEINQMDRRNFLLKTFMGGMGLSSMASPASMVFATLFNEFMGKAHAQSTGADSTFNDYNFINILIENGTTRCLFDLPLRPTATDVFLQNAYSGNKIDANLNIIHQSVTHSSFNGIQMPYIWASNIPTPNGGSVPMANLAPHFLMIRGINQLFDGHGFNRTLQLIPGTGVSLTGLAADASTTPISSLSMSTSGSLPAFASKKGLSAKLIYSINDALSVFTGSSSLTEISNSSVDTAIDNLLNLMRDRPIEKHPFLPTTYLDRRNAKAMMKKNFGDVTVAFNTLKAKYADLMTRAFTDSSFFLADVENLAIPGDFASVKFNIDDPNRFTGTNIQDIFINTSKINNLAESMAITEYMMVNRITSSLAANIGSLSNMNWQQYKNITTGAVVNGEISGINLDFHTVGSVMNVFMMTKYYRAVAACLYELITQLKNTARPAGGNLFDRTIIALNGDFNRNGRTDMKGSDHGYNGSSYTIISGMNQQCNVVGNISRTDTNTNYVGTWGKAAAVSANNNRELLIGNAASTVAAMMDLPSPTPNDSAVATKNSTTGLMTPSLPRGTNV
jgi:hypothetical protein